MRFPQPPQLGFTLADLRQVLFNLLLMSLGAVLTAAAVNGIIIPHHFAAGGATGLAVIIQQVVPLDVGVIYLLVNIPLFLTAYMAVGRRFFFYSLAGTMLFSLALALVKFEFLVEDPILASILAGLIFGLGIGITLRSQGSAGGGDILSVMLMMRFSIPLGTSLLALNILVLILTAGVFSLDAALYTLIQIYIAGVLINLAVTGLSQRKAVMIISHQWPEINREILRDLRHGTTVIPARGGYSGNEEQILYAVVNFREIGSLKRMVRQIDPHAFVVVTDTMEVMNYRIGNQPHW
ncbi:MAG: YitT family protein [Desulfurivibrio sp.]|nr:YitT family protein [Desulfurivibrio sp.]